MAGQYDIVECSRLSPNVAPAKLMAGACVKRWRVAAGKMDAKPPIGGMIRNSPCRGCPIGEERSAGIELVYGNPPAHVSTCRTPGCENTIVGNALKKKCEACLEAAREKTAKKAADSAKERSHRREKPWPSTPPRGRPADMVELPEREEADEPDEMVEQVNAALNAGLPESTAKEEPAEPGQEDDMPTPSAPPGAPIRPAMPPTGGPPSAEELLYVPPDGGKPEWVRPDGPLDPEVAAMGAVARALEQIDPSARCRVMDWARARFQEGS